MHALYGFTRCTDDIVNAPPPVAGTPGHAARGPGWIPGPGIFTRPFDGTAPAGHPVLVAVQHTIGTFGLDLTDFEAFFASMRMDLRVREYPDYDALLGYMEGSAAVIGTMMLPILLAPERGAGPDPPAGRGRAPGCCPGTRAGVPADQLPP